MLTIAQRPLEATRTPERSCSWLAECEVAGGRFEVRSWRSAPAELARLLVAAGIPDQAVEIRGGVASLPPDTVTLRFRSLHVMAKWTYEESAAMPLRRSRYRPPPEWAGFRGGEGKSRGEATAPAGSPSTDPVPALAAE